MTTNHISPDIIMPGLRPRIIELMLIELGNLQTHNNPLTDRRRRRLLLWLSLLLRTADVVLLWSSLLLVVVVTSLAV